MKRGKKYLQVIDKLKGNLFTPLEAIKWIKENHYANFDESVDISINLGVDPRKADQMVRNTVVLPHGTGRVLKILVFAQGPKAEEAKNAGAEYVGGEELVEKIKGGWLDFDVCIATPDMMKYVGKLGKILGPRRLMPNPKSGTVTMDIEKSIKDVKKGKLEFRTDKYGIIHTTIGKVSFDLKKLLENYLAIIDSVIKSKPPAAKGKYIKSVYISSTMGPSVKIDIGKILDVNMGEVA